MASMLKQANEWGTLSISSVRIRKYDTSCTINHLTSWHLDRLGLLHCHDGFTRSQTFEGIQADLILSLRGEVTDIDGCLGWPHVQLLAFHSSKHGDEGDLVASDITQRGIPCHPHWLRCDFCDLQVWGRLHHWGIIAGNLLLHELSRCIQY